LASFEKDYTGMHGKQNKISLPSLHVQRKASEVCRL